MSDGAKLLIAYVCATVAKERHDSPAASPPGNNKQTNSSSLGIELLLKNKLECCAENSNGTVSVIRSSPGKGGAE
jgi:hypothetical protein